MKREPLKHSRILKEAPAHGRGAITELGSPSVRVTLRFLEDGEQMIFDLHIDAERRVQGNWIYFGLLRDDRAETYCPCILDKTGEIDFGTEASTGNRFWRTNLRSRVIRQGETISVWGEDEEEWLCRIEAVTHLNEKGI